MKILNLVQTCKFCPSQWEFVTDDNRPVYVRYRWGYLSVRIGQPDENIQNAVGGTEIYGERIGDSFDGYITWDKIFDRIKDIDISKILARKDKE